MTGGGQSVGMAPRVAFETDTARSPADKLIHTQDSVAVKPDNGRTNLDKVTFSLDRVPASADKA